MIVTVYITLLQIGEIIVKFFRLILEITVLYSIYLVGVYIQRTFQLFIPGSIIGMLFLFLLLQTKVVKVSWIEKGSSFLISYLPLLFLPVTIGIIKYEELYTLKGILLVIAIIVSTALLMLMTGAISQQMMRKRRYENE